MLITILDYVCKMSWRGSTFLYQSLYSLILLFFKRKNAILIFGSYSGTSEFFYPNTEPLTCKICILRGLAKYEVRSLKIFGIFICDLDLFLRHLSGCRIILLGFPLPVFLCL